MENQITTNKKLPIQKLSIWGLGIGLVSIFLFWIGIICYIGMVVNIISLITFRRSHHNKRSLWYAIIGLILSALYALVNANENGHLG